MNWKHSESIIKHETILQTGITYERISLQKASEFVMDLK